MDGGPEAQTRKVAVQADEIGAPNRGPGRVRIETATAEADVRGMAEEMTAMRTESERLRQEVAQLRSEAAAARAELGDAKRGARLLRMSLAARERQAKRGRPLKGALQRDKDREPDE